MATKRYVCAFFFAITLTFAQRAMTVAEVVSFIKSSIKQKQDDRLVADYLQKRVKLSEKLDERTIEDLQGMGAGPRTTSALRRLSTESASLPAAAPPAPPPPPPPPIPPPDSIEQKAILSEIQENALSYTRGLPNYICTQVTRRNVDSTGTGEHWRLADTIQEQLTFFDHKEKYVVTMISGRVVTNVDHEKLGGATSSGEFGSMMAEIFDPATEAEFNWHHLGKWDGRVTNVFSYRVRQPQSHYSIEHVPSNRKIIVGYHGLVYATRDANAVVHITLEADDIPRDFPIQEVKTELTYDVAKISGQEYILPLKWEMHSRDGKYLSWNSAEYALYRKFETTTTLTFDEPDPVPESKTKEEPLPAPVKKKP